MLSYDVFTQAFLDKITEYEFPHDDVQKASMVDRYMKRAITHFKNICLYDLSTTADDNVREFDVEIAPEDVDELAEIISEGMVVQWIQPYANRTDVLQNVMNTRDFTTYSPANMLTALRAAYVEAKQKYDYSCREYSYRHGNLTDLHT